MYTFISALLRKKGKNQRFQQVNLTNVKMSTLYSTYRDGYIELSNPSLRNNIFVKLTDLKADGNLVYTDSFFPVWLSVQGNKTITGSVIKPKMFNNQITFSDAVQAGCEIKRVRQSDLAGKTVYPPDMTPDVFLYKTLSDYTLMQRYILTTVNGLCHINIPAQRGILIKDAGKSLDKDGKKFELSSGLESLKVNEKVATSIGAVLEAFAASVKAGEELFKSKEIAKFGQSIAKAINKYDPETAAAAGEKLNNVVNSVLNKPITLGKLSGVNRFSKDYDVFGMTGCLGGKAFIARVRKGLMDAKTPLENAEILRSYRVEFTTLTDKKVKAPASVKFETLTFDQMDKALIAVGDALSMLEAFHRGSARKD